MEKGVGKITIQRVTTAGLHYNATPWTVVEEVHFFLRFLHYKVKMLV